MAPLFVSRDQADDDSATLHDHATTRMIWVIVTVVTVSLAFITVVVIVAIKWFKTEPMRKRKRKSPYAAKKNVSRRRKMSDLDRVEEEELQRQVMIRKSLASRTSFRTESRLCPSSSEEELDVADETGSLRSDWKEWEARLHRQRTLSFEIHPATATPTSRSQTDLAVRAPARAESPSRRLSRSPAPRPMPSPALPRIPSEESLNSKAQFSACVMPVSPLETPKGYAGYGRLDMSEH